MAANVAGCGTGGGRSAADAAARVAPIWVHGDGQAEEYSGCAGSPPIPIYLSEDQGLEIIRDELARLGVALTPSDAKPPTVSVPCKQLVFSHEWVSGADDLRPVDVYGPFTLDIAASTPAICIEFVSRTDYPAPAWQASLGYGKYDLKELAANVSQAVEKQCHEFYFGAFYDPVAYRSRRELLPNGAPYQLYVELSAANTEQEKENIFEQIRRYEDKEKATVEEQARRESEQLLRLQVQDFVEWLKGQGVI
jgi:hypothetical protein